MRFYRFFITLVLIASVFAGFVFVNPPLGYRMISGGVVAGALFLVLAILVSFPPWKVSVFFFLSAGGWLYGVGAMLGFLGYYPCMKMEPIPWILALVVAVVAYICIRFGIVEMKNQ